MFTGIVEEVGTINSLKVIGADQSELTVDCSVIQSDMKRGDSVAVEGVCLTVIRFDAAHVVFEISSETVKKTLFSQKRSGQRVNLERALMLTDRLGGHMVQGHVDGCARVLNIKRLGNFYELEFDLPRDIDRYFVDKGSVCINGISLTIASLGNDRFSVAIIPHTYQQTTLSDLNVSDTVHIETDVLARYVERLLPFAKKTEESKISPEFLREHGF
jgi:riboflavin synthase